MISNWISACVLALSLISLIVGMWNAYQAAIVGRIIAELHLNIRKEFNGRYITLDSYGDLKQRVARLEAQQDFSDFKPN